MIENLVLLGSGSFAEEVADLAGDTGLFELVAFIEGLDRTKCGQQLLKRPILWIKEVKQLAITCRGVCAVGSIKRTAFIQQARALGLAFTRIVHQRARVSQTAVLGNGTIICPGAIIATQTHVGDHVIINRGALIGHHAHLGDYTTVGPGANIAGRTRLGAAVQIGMGAVVLDGVSIGTGAIVGAGAVVTKDVPPKVQVMGIPARVVKELP